MRTILALVIAALVPLLPPPADNPPPKEWQPLIDATTSAIRKKDAAALQKLVMSYAELNATCSKDPAGRKEAEDMDNARSRGIARALQDCNIMNWKTAKFVSASGGEPAISRCDQYKPVKNISLLYQDGPLMWTITLEPTMLNGKRLLRTQPNCLAGMKK